MGDCGRRLFCLLIGVEEWFFLLFRTYWGFIRGYYYYYGRMGYIYIG
jgi:hypothetical protein